MDRHLHHPENCNKSNTIMYGTPALISQRVQNITMYGTPALISQQETTTMHGTPALISQQVCMQRCMEHPHINQLQDGECHIMQ